MLAAHTHNGAPGIGGLPLGMHASLPTLCRAKALYGPLMMRCE
jgi:hypothetical protein